MQWLWQSWPIQSTSVGVMITPSSCAWNYGGKSQTTLAVCFCSLPSTSNVEGWTSECGSLLLLNTTLPSPHYLYHSTFIVHIAACVYIPHPIHAPHYLYDDDKGQLSSVLWPSRRTLCWQRPILTWGMCLRKEGSSNKPWITTTMPSDSSQSLWMATSTLQLHWSLLESFTRLSMHT